MKPSDFMLGLLDFLAILLPGAVATWLLTQYLEQLPPGFGYVRDLGTTESPLPWVVVVFTSYALGHFVFMAGSRLDPVYDRWRKRTKPEESDRNYSAARELHHRLTPQLAYPELSTLKWARTYILLHAQPACAEIDRLEASSKFFRSMVVVSALAVAHFLLTVGEPVFAVQSATLCALSFWRYCEERWKMTELAYVTVIVLHDTKVAKADQNGATG